MESVLLDTDIGSDIDDALALAYLIRQPECELVGITTVTGEPELRAGLAAEICREMGRTDIPIHVGCANPLLIAPEQAKAHQAGALAGIRDGKTFSARPTAVDFLRETIRARPDEITLLAIGPLTNIAVLFLLDPEIPRLLKRFAIMGGRFHRPTPARGAGAEWNIRCDPHSAAIVFNSDCLITAVGLEVTTLCAMSPDSCRPRLAQPGMPKIIEPMAEEWLRRCDRVVFHDPLAAAVIFEPALCRFETGSAEVGIQRGRGFGATFWRKSNCGRHRVAASVEPDAFFAHYFETTIPNG
jgi:purine nucleosidase